MDIAVLSLLIISTISCALVGVYIVSFKASMLIEGLTHTILLGTVLMYLIFNKTNTLAILVASVFSGIFLIFLIEIFSKSKFISKDIAVGIVMPLLFSIAIVLISGPLKNSRLSKEMILTGNIILATYSELIGGVFPVSILVNIIILIINIATVSTLYKELSLAAFDNNFATSINMHPRKIYYLFLINITLTTGASLDAFGIILVIGMLVIPASIGILISKNQKQFIFITITIAIATSLGGYIIATALDLTHSGTITTFGLLILILTVLFRKNGGAVYTVIHRNKLKNELNELLILNLINKKSLINVSEASETLNWNTEKTQKILNRLQAKGYLIQGGTIQITEGGSTALNKYNNQNSIC